MSATQALKNLQNPIKAGFSLGRRFGGREQNILFRLAIAASLALRATHSVYDSFDHYLRFGDPDFAYGVALAKTIGHVMLRVAEADLLPMRFSDFADTVGQYVEESGCRLAPENQQFAPGTFSCLSGFVI